MSYRLVSGSGIHEYTLGEMQKVGDEEYIILQLTVPMRSVSQARYDEALMALKTMYPNTKTDKFLIIGSDVDIYSIPTKEAVKLKMKGII